MKVELQNSTFQLVKFHCLNQHRHLETDISISQTQIANPQRMTALSYPILEIQNAVHPSAYISDRIAKSYVDQHGVLYEYLRRLSLHRGCGQNTAHLPETHLKSLGIGTNCSDS